ncbi:MAG TPA: hypothetical protein VHL52_03190 [Acidimicrobiia bacterium]|nr:hypothetical protein [Acidimicrobiia bacterium]
MHSADPDDAGTGGDFSVTGRGVPVEDRDRWEQVAETSSYRPLDRYVLFEQQVSEARCNGYGDVALPATRRWSVDRLGG